MHTFLPENYEAPRSGGYYMKIQQGENKIRILSKPIIGWEDWGLDNKPIRFAYDKRPEKAIKSDKPIRHFWAFVVWNYAEEAIQILQVTQAGIRKGIETLCNDADWGAPYFYDIKIIKTGEELKTKYQVNPLPHKAIGENVVQAFKDRPVYLEALFVNEDPFAAHWPKKTQLMATMENSPKESVFQPKANDVISIDQANELNAILMTCDSAYKRSVMETLSRAPLNVKEIKDLPVSYYEKVKNAALRKRDEFNGFQDMNFAMA